MKITLLTFILLTSLSFGQAIKFPYPFKMNHIYQECNACNNVAYHKWELLGGQNFPSPTLKAVAEDKIWSKNYSQKMKNTFSETLSEQDHATTECQMTRTGKHAWLEKSTPESSQISKEEFDKMKVELQNKKAQEVENKRNQLKSDSIYEIRSLKLKRIGELRVKANGSSTIADLISNFTQLIDEETSYWKSSDVCFDGKRLLLENFNSDMISAYSYDISNLGYGFILNKEFEKAYQLLSSYIESRKNINCEYDANYLGVLKSMSHSILFSKRDENKFWDLIKILNEDPNFYIAINKDYNQLNKFGITDPRIPEIIIKIQDLKFGNLNRDNDSKYKRKFFLADTINLKEQFKINIAFVNNSVTIRDAMFKIFDKIKSVPRGNEGTKIEDNLFSIVINSMMYFYSYDIDGNILLLSCCKENINEKKLIVKIEESKKIKLDLEKKSIQPYRYF